MEPLGRKGKQPHAFTGRVKEQENEPMLRHTTLCAFVVVMMVMGAAYAETPDGACDGLADNAWGLCNAYCYAMDCGGKRNASARECSQVASNFIRATGMEKMPCDTPIAPTDSPLGSLGIGGSPILLLPPCCPDLRPHLP